MQNYNRKQMLLWHVETDEISVTKAETECELYKTTILPAEFYGCESWTLCKAHESLLGGFERTILNRIYGAVKIDGVWQRCYNQELYSLFNDDIIKRIKISRLIWAGHGIRRENEEIIKRLTIVKLEGKRKKGRPRMRWMDGVEKDLKNLGVVNWRAKTQDRDGWRKFLEQAKTHERL
jgi:hypothetical protein